MSDWIFEIHQLWQSSFRRLHSNSFCSCSFEAEIIKLGQSSHKMYSNKILNFQESTTILNTRRKGVWKLIVCTSYLSFFSVTPVYNPCSYFNLFYFLLRISSNNKLQKNAIMLKKYFLNSEYLVQIKAPIKICKSFFLPYIHLYFIWPTNNKVGNKLKLFVFVLIRLIWRLIPFYI